MTDFWDLFFHALIPICICVVLPTLVIWLIGRVKQNETNRKAEIMLKALDNGAIIDSDFFKGLAVPDCLQLLYRQPAETSSADGRFECSRDLTRC